ncbi:MAG: xanthan lyase, partial [Bacteroidaceae bacterium]|nr:xanthan lyase [Bacteroidaceae bacterium]
MKRLIIYILLAGMMPNAFAQDLQKIFSDYLKTYARADARLNPTSTLESCSVNDDNKSIRLTCGGGFGEQFFTEEAVNQIYRNFKELLPKKYKNYKLIIVTDRHAIEELIPNAMRHGKKDKSRRWEYESKDEAWVKNLSRPYSIQDGLDGTHISLWQSHGKVYRENKGVWEWQRPRLYCTTEDLFSQTFVIPFIIPMLENAGATVYTP